MLGEQSGRGKKVEGYRWRFLRKSETSSSLLLKANIIILPTLHRLFLISFNSHNNPMSKSDMNKKLEYSGHSLGLEVHGEKLHGVAHMRSIWTFDQCQQLESMPNGFGFELIKWIFFACLTVCLLSLTIPNMPSRFGNNPSQDFGIIWWPTNRRAETLPSCIESYEIVIFVGPVRFQIAQHNCT